jgi:hypothetical protein
MRPGSAWMVGKTGRNPFHPSVGPLFPRRLQFQIPVGLNLLLMPGEDVLRRCLRHARPLGCSAPTRSGISRSRNRCHANKISHNPISSVRSPRVRIPGDGDRDSGLIVTQGKLSSRTDSYDSPPVNHANRRLCKLLARTNRKAQLAGQFKCDHCNQRVEIIEETTPQNPPK